ncbi:transposase [Flaviflexus ciconiae]|uniref:Transposase n=1 Tax=Flaviflexus ciconiae TaxID=2496867 RepID=A0A3Q9G737_9ACTO|nr:transposase [Flaviflexus ciconiae]AZQ76780.1 transposase [Flaviflexus ciconiae]
MAKGSRRKFSPQFKAEVVQLVVQNERQIIDVARELQINAGTLGHWVAKYRMENPEPVKDLSPADQVRLVELEEEVRRLLN